MAAVGMGSTATVGASSTDAGSVTATIGSSALTTSTGSASWGLHSASGSFPSSGIPSGSRHRTLRTPTRKSAPAGGSRSPPLRSANGTMFCRIVGAIPGPGGHCASLNYQERNPMRTLVIWSTVLVLATAVNARAAEPKLETEEQKTLDALGLTINRSLSPFNLSASELELVEAGLADGSLHKAAKVDLETYGPRIKQIQETRAAAVAAAEKKSGQVFVDQAAREPGA